MKVRTVKLFGFDVDVYNFGYSWYMYPNFNGNAEFKVNSEGFKKLSSYLRTCIWIRNLN